MITISNVLAGINDQTQSDPEEIRTQLMDVCSQAHEAYIRSVGGETIMYTMSFEERVSYCQIRKWFKQADAMAEMRSGFAAGAPWKELHSIAVKVVDEFGAHNVIYLSRVRNRPEFVEKVEVEALGRRRAFSIWHGNLAAMDGVDALVVSGYEGFDGAPRGQVVKALTRRYEVDWQAVQFEISLNAEIKLKFCKGIDRPSLLVLQMPGDLRAHDPAGWQEEFAVVMRGCFASLMALEMMGVKFGVVAMPILLGNQTKYSDLMMSVMIEVSADWLRRSRYCEDVRLVVFYRKDAEGWAESMDRVLGRTVQLGASSELLKLCSRINEASLVGGEELRSMLSELRDACAEVTVNASRIGNAARQMAEVYARWVVSTQSNALLSKLKNLGCVSQDKDVKACFDPWELTFVDTIRQIGNMYSHNGVKPESGSDVELYCLKSALQSSLGLVGAYHSRNSKNNVLL